MSLLKEECILMQLVQKDTIFYLAMPSLPSHCRISACLGSGVHWFQSQDGDDIMEPLT